MSAGGSTARRRWLAPIIVVCLAPWLQARGPAPQGGGQSPPSATTAPPAETLTFGAFTATFAPGGALRLRGDGWPALDGTWVIEAGVLVLRAAPAPRGCDGEGRYRPNRDGARYTLAVIEDACEPRRMILDGSTWRPVTEPADRPARRIVRTAGSDAPLPAAAGDEGAWPGFRGPAASGVADGQDLPGTWDVNAGEGVRWRVPIPGLAHSSPIVWGDRIFVTTAISRDPAATFRPGLYGDGDASADRSVHRWVLMAIDARTGRTLWERVADEGAPRQKRHVKSTYASATPATDGRIVVASFGSQGVFAYDVDGTFRWKVDLGRLDLGAYDIPTYEWGTASSPTIWGGLVFLQCDTQQDSFVLALDARTGETVWRTAREELPSWSSPNVIEALSGPELVTNAPNAIRAYDPRTGTELWRIGPSSRITAPTPVGRDGFVVVASGRAPERPIHVVRAGARGDLTTSGGRPAPESVAWSRMGRGSYMPTPLIYRGAVYVLANNGVFDAYDLATGAEIYRARVPHPGSGFSASPVAADGLIYLSSEDGDVTVVRAGSAFEAVGTFPMGDLIMATPAISRGTLYVRTAGSLIAIGRR
ncbi:MAG: PQQ-binding-like beta-propeller repeat protein [Vicinamibacterales bacterium]